MSIFKSVVEEQNTELATRYQHLLQHAKNLEVESVLTKEFDEITEEALIELKLTIDKEVMFKEVREELGLDKEFHIDSVEHLDWYLKKKLHLTAELEAIKIQYEKEKKHLDSNLNKLDTLYSEEAEGYTNSEYQKTGRKTMNRPYGSVQLRDEKASWRISEEKELQAWLATLTDEERTELKCKPKEWTRDLDAIKSRAEMIRQKQGLEYVMGLEYTPAGRHFKLIMPKEKTE